MRPTAGSGHFRVQQLAAHRMDRQRVYPVDRDLPGPATCRQDDGRRGKRPLGRVHDDAGGGGLDALNARSREVRAARLAGTPEGARHRRRAGVPVRRRKEGAHAAGGDVAFELPRIRPLQVAASDTPRRVRARDCLQLGRLRIVERDLQRSSAGIHLRGHLAIEQPLNERVP